MRDWLPFLPKQVDLFSPVVDGVGWWGGALLAKHLHLIVRFLGFIYLFLERGEWKEKERERIMNLSFACHAPQLGTWPTKPRHVT